MNVVRFLMNNIFFVEISRLKKLIVENNPYKNLKNKIKFDFSLTRVNGFDKLFTDGGINSE